MQARVPGGATVGIERKGCTRENSVQAQAMLQKSVQCPGAGGGKETAGLDGDPTGRTPQLKSPESENRCTYGYPPVQSCVHAAGAQGEPGPVRMEDPRGKG
eukprot:8333788-Heterocapsa_arctica.AAC.1